jgi:hypothetical protein
VCYEADVIVALHAATGATAGVALRSRTGAVLLGIPLHIAADHVPHADIRNVGFEVGSGLAVVALLAKVRGVTDRATLGALATCAADAEHLIRLPRPGGRKLFHRGRGGHESRHVSAGAQLLVAGMLIARLLLLPKDHVTA